MRKRQIEIEMLAKKILELELEYDDKISDDERMQQMTVLMLNVKPDILLETMEYLEENKKIS